MRGQMYNEMDGGSKKKSTLRNSQFPQQFHNFMEDSNSKKRISWGGIHTRWFNEQGNQNWDLSPQSLRSGSDKSRSIDQSNLTDEKMYLQSQVVAPTSQNANKENIKKNNVVVEEQKQNNMPSDRLSMYFHSNEENDNNLIEESLLLPSRTSMNNDNIQRRISNDQQHIANIQRRISSPANTFKFAQRGQYSDAAFQEDSQQYNDSESNLLDNLDRLSRLSGLFNDSDINKQNDTSDILQPIKGDIQNYQNMQQAQQQGQQYFNLQQQAQNNKDTIVFMNDQNKQTGFQNQPIENKQIFNIFSDFSQNGQILPVNQAQITPQVNERSLKSNNMIDEVNFPNNKNENIKKNDINRILFKNENEGSINQQDLRKYQNGAQQQNNVESSNQVEQNQKDYRRLSEFFQQEQAKPEQKGTNKIEELPAGNNINQSKQSDKVIFDSNFSSSNYQILDSQKRTYPFSLGFVSDVFNESKSSGIDNSSYLLECMDKVNRLSEVNPTRPNDMIGEERVLKKQQPLITPSPLVNDLKSLTLDLEEDEKFSKHINSVVKIAKEKKVRMKDELDEIKSGDLFSNEYVYDEQQHQPNQQKPKSILTSQKQQQGMLEPQSILTQQKVQMKQQLSQLINGNQTSGQNGQQGKVSPKKISISRAILPNSSVSKEIKRLSTLQNENQPKGVQFNQQTTKVDSNTNSKDKSFFNGQVKNTQDNKDNIHSSYPNNLQGTDLLKSDALKTPMRKSNLFYEEEHHQSGDSDDLYEGIQQLENIVVKMPLNSYEKKVILNFLTPGKKSKNLQLVRESILTNNNNHLPKHLENQNDPQQINQLSENHKLTEPENTEDIIENLCDSYQQEIRKVSEKVEASQANAKRLQEIIEKNNIEIQKEEEELRRLEEQISERQQNQKQQSSDQKDVQSKIVQSQNKQHVLYTNQYWQTYQIVIHYFGFEYLGKIKDKHSKSDMISFRFLNKYLCSLQMAKKRHQDSILLVFIKCFVYSLYQHQEDQLSTNKSLQHSEVEIKYSSFSELLSCGNISKITERLIARRFQNYESKNGNVIEILQYIGSKLSELEEFNHQMKAISTIYSVNSYTYNPSSLAISFQLKLTQFPQKLVRFVISPESWFNEISIQVINLPIAGSDEINSKLNEEIDKSINTQFNSKINSQSTYQKLRMIIDAINVKNAIEPVANNESNTSARLSESSLQHSSSKE